MGQYPVIDIRLEVGAVRDAPDRYGRVRRRSPAVETIVNAVFLKVGDVAQAAEPPFQAVLLARFAGGNPAITRARMRLRSYLASFAAKAAIRSPHSCVVSR